MLLDDEDVFELVVDIFEEDVVVVEDTDEMFAEDVVDDLVDDVVVEDEILDVLKLEELLSASEVLVEDEL